ncbi:MAG: hypothetical protein GC190_01070 [Alphaproteobacteria bacterium]|nr:hypothetical protein [Alphaproteobacteria bacterium]
MVANRLRDLWDRFEARVRREPGLVGAWALVVAFGLFVLIHGKDVSWDVRNYHWYNPYALLTGRRGFDVAVAQHATYYNPMIDVPVYAGAQVMPAWLVGLLLGLVQGLNALLLYLLTTRALDARIAQSIRSWIGMGIAAAGLLGGMTLQLGGVLSQDLTVSLFVLGALVVLMRAEAATAGAKDDLFRVGAAGVLGGIAIGLKLTMMPFAFGLAAGVAVLSAPWQERWKRIAALGAGGLIGAIIFGGSWALVLWRETGNPIFPYFNDVFGSPLLLSASYRDTRFLPSGMLEAWIYPFLFSVDGTRVADAPFRDVKIMIVYILAPIALALWSMRRAAGDRVFSDQSVRLLFAFSAVSYVVWLNIFAIYRYVVTLELAAPLLIAMAIDFVPTTLRYRRYATAVVLTLSVFALGWSSAIDPRPAWGTRFIAVDVPTLEHPDQSMVLMAGTEPSSYVIPSFPPQVPFLRIDSWLDTPQSHTRFGNRMRMRVAAHRGPLFAIFADWERARVLAAFAEYGLAIEPAQCSKIVSNAGPPLNWCPLTRRALA